MIRGIVLGTSTTNRIIATNINFNYAGVIVNQTTAASLIIAASAGLPGSGRAVDLLGRHHVVRWFRQRSHGQLDAHQRHSHQRISAVCS